MSTNKRTVAKKNSKKKSDEKSFVTSSVSAKFLAVFNIAIVVDERSVVCTTAWGSRTRRRSKAVAVAGVQSS